MAETTTKVIELNDDNFEDVVLNSDVPVLVDYWATYCGPCKMISPIIEDLALDADYAGKVVFGKLNIEDNSKYSTQFMVMALPTLQIFKEGKMKQALTGVPTKVKIKKAIDSHI